MKFCEIWLDPIFDAFPNLAIHESVYHELVADAVKKYADERQSESPSHLRVYKDAELNEAEQALMQAYISKLAEYSQYIPERDNAKDRGEVRSLSFMAVKRFLYFAANDTLPMNLIRKADELHALDVVNQGMQEKQSITVRCMDIEDLEKQAEAIRVEQIKLYESYADGVLRRDAYIEKKKALSEKLAALQDSIRTEKEEQECADELDEEISALTKQASEKTYIGGLTKECVDAFVSMVYLYDDQTMKIEFNCEDVIRRALEKYA